MNAVNSGQSELQAAVPRMDVASLIAAKRKALKQGKLGEKETDEKEANSVSESESGEDDDKDDGSSSSNSDDSSSSSEDDSDSEDEEEDAAHGMEKDVLKVKSKGDDKHESKEEEEAGEEEEEDSDDDDDDDQASSDDEEDKVEAKKADAFFESQSTPSGSKDTVELFVQLTLSRPLLRGVAAMGFVKPTPIQASCIPVALSGRDICGSAVTGSGKTAGKFEHLGRRFLYTI